MTTVSEVKKSNKILNFYGNEHQLIKAVEEMGELQMAIAKYLNGEANNIEEEIADVTVMMMQLTIGLDTEKIDQMVMSKLDRQLDRILGEEIDSVVAENESHGQWYSLDKDGIPQSRELTEDEWNAIVDKLKFEAEANGIEITETEGE